MIADNCITLNGATLKQAIQEWLNKRWKGTETTPIVKDFQWIGSRLNVEVEGRESSEHED